jgi:RNA polymerase sigma-70 factor (ECF subfamily)
MSEMSSRDDGPTFAPPGKAEAREQELIGRVAQGDRIAFEKLYRGYYPRLTRFLDRMTRRPHLVEELLNDTMFVVWERSHTFTYRSRVSTWIFGIAYRKGLQALRDLEDPVDFDFESVSDAGESGPDQQLMRIQLQRLLSEAVDALSAAHRTVIELTYFHGAGYREIAEIMDCPVDTVKTRMFHARRRLRTLLPGGTEGML